MMSETPAWWNDHSQAVYDRLPEGALMGYSVGDSDGRDQLSMARWHTLRKFEQATPAPESHDPGGDAA